MKLAGRELARFAARPDPGHPAILIHGPDPMRVADLRAAIIRGLAGENAEAEMRLERLAAGDVKADPAILADAMKATGFFAGQRVVRIDEATDALAPALAAALDAWAPGDAVAVLTAGNLTPRSALRKLVEGHPKAIAAPVYADAATPEALRAALREAGLAAFTPEGERDALTLGRSLEPGEFRQFVERLALYKHGDAEPVTPADVAACAPLAPDAEVDALIAKVAEGRAGE
ncbi:MAG: DNA polymerase III subunit delta, partial [Alphaproteobacteria bacterium]